MTEQNEKVLTMPYRMRVHFRVPKDWDLSRFPEGEINDIENTEANRLIFTMLARLGIVTACGEADIPPGSGDEGQMAFISY